MEAKKSTKSTKRAYRRYDDHVKREAVRQLEQEGAVVSQLAEALGVTPSLLHRWKAQAQKSDEVLEQAAEVKRLTKELKARDQEVDILKKALRIFSQAD